MAQLAVDTAALAQLRRELRQLDPVIRRTLDRELRGIGRDIAQRANQLSVKDSGRFASSWKSSVTARKGVAVVNRQPYARQQEYGGKVWLRRGLPYQAKGTGNVRARGRGGASLPLRQVTLGRTATGALIIQNEAQYLIKRSAPGRRATQQLEAESVRRIGEAASRAIERAIS